MNNLQKCLDLEYLKTKIKKGQYLNLKNKENYKLKKNIIFPIHYYNSIKKFCKNVYNVDIIISGADEYDCYYSPNEEKICLYFEKESCVSIFTVQTCFFHELSHHIQKQVFNYYDENWGKHSLEFYIKFERTAERLAYFLHKEHFKIDNKFEHLHHSCFSAYKSRRHINFLKKQYKIKEEK